MQNTDASSDLREPAQPPGSQLQFFEEDDQDVVVDPGTRNEEQEPDGSGLLALLNFRRPLENVHTPHQNWLLV